MRLRNKCEVSFHTREEDLMAYRASERHQRRQAMRTRLLDAARLLFIHQGYAATTIPQVVQLAGTSVGNCYFYFANKEALLHGVVEEFIQQIAQQIDAATAAVAPGPPQLAVALARGVQVALEQKELIRVLFIEKPELRSLVLEHFASRLSDFLSRGNIPFSPLEQRRIVLAYQGAVFQLIEAVLSGDLQEDAHALGRFLACWNLQALGLPPEAVAQGLAALDTTQFPSQGKRSPTPPSS